MRQSTPMQPSRGVSLIEAMVALAVMSFGMLALVGVQATMRFNSDVARQRTEATRIASEDMERMRLFTDVVTSPTQTADSWDELSDNSIAALNLPGNTANTTFSLTRTLVRVEDTDGTDPRYSASSMKVVETLVEWDDRTTPANPTERNKALLNTVIVRAAPALSAALSLPANGGAPSRQGGRHISIPVLAKDLGDGRSAFKPFNQGTTVWVLSNTTGYVNSVCSAVVSTQNAITAGDLTSCTTVQGRLVTGKVRFDLSAAVDAAASERPAGPVLPLDSTTPLVFYAGLDNPPVNQSTPASCVADVPASPPLAAVPRSEIAYACLVFPSDATGWGGQLNLVPGNYPDGTPGNHPDPTPDIWRIGSIAGQYKVCRYTLASEPQTVNVDHPKTYCKVNPAQPNICSSRVTGNLGNQNFLVIRGDNNCPTDVAIRPALGDLVNSNTLLHQN